MIENIKSNFKECYKPNLSCNYFNKSECDQKHLLECSELLGKKRNYIIHSKLDGVGPVDNRPSPAKLHHVDQKKRRKKCDM